MLDHTTCEGSCVCKSNLIVCGKFPNTGKNACGAHLCCHPILKQFESVLLYNFSRAMQGCMQCIVYRRAIEQVHLSSSTGTTSLKHGTSIMNDTVHCKVFLSKENRE